MTTKLSDYDYFLPKELIAQKPLKNRSESRLLQLDGISGNLNDGSFQDIVNLISPGDLLVFNNTKVIPARLYGQKETGGKIEILVERVLGNTSCLAHVKASKSPKAGSIIRLANHFDMAVLGREDSLFQLELVNKDESLFTQMEQFGHIPLPPYIERDDDEDDQERYQTVYAEKPGAVAAPTAGLHFDKRLLEELTAKGVNTAAVTLHVGAGTFQPVKHEDLSQHIMHKEYIEVDEETCQRIIECKQSGGKVVAVGTTSVRTLESIAIDGHLKPFTGDTQLFITPGYHFQIVDAMITNFHLPKSTLMMLVSAFAGHKNIMDAYQHATKEKYRFFSYGDAMFLTKKQGSMKHD